MLGEKANEKRMIRGLKLFCREKISLPFYFRRINFSHEYVSWIEIINVFFPCNYRAIESMRLIEISRKISVCNLNFGESWRDLWSEFWNFFPCSFFLYELSNRFLRCVSRKPVESCGKCRWIISRLYTRVWGTNIEPGNPEGYRRIV